MPRIIERNLPLSNHYRVISIRRQTLENLEGFVQICDNCNAEIINIGIIADNHGNRFEVGLDCLKTLTKAVVNLSEMEDLLYDFKAVLRDVGRMKDAESIEESEYAYRINYRTKANKRAVAVLFKHQLAQFNISL